MKKWIWIFMTVCLLALPLNGFGADKEITVGSKEFTEQRILGQLMIALLQEHGFDTKDRTGLGGTMVARTALTTGQIDVYMEYTGTGLLTILKHDEPITDPIECYDTVKAEDMKKNDVVWLPMMSFNNTYTLMMREEDAKEKGIESLSDLAEYVQENPQEISFGLNAEFYARPDGYRPLQKAYDFQFPSNKIKKMDSGLVYKALQDKEVDVSMGFATDGRIEAFNFVTLVDDKNFFPVYNPAPTVRKETADKYIELQKIFAALGAKLNTEAMTKLNYAVDIEHKRASEVAKEWLKKEGLISG
ncbi:MAG: glycine betaine ABC transporter substrate-binding protein [Thermodesulfobacteriota bacterium]